MESRTTWHPTLRLWHHHHSTTVASDTKYTRRTGRRGTRLYLSLNGERYMHRTCVPTRDLVRVRAHVIRFTKGWKWKTILTKQPVSTTYLRCILPHTRAPFRIRTPYISEASRRWRNNEPRNCSSIKGEMSRKWARIVRRTRKNERRRRKEKHRPFFPITYTYGKFIINARLHRRCRDERWWKKKKHQQKIESPLAFIAHQYSIVANTFSTCQFVIVQSSVNFLLQIATPG